MSGPYNSGYIVRHDLVMTTLYVGYKTKFTLAIRFVYVGIFILSWNVLGCQLKAAEPVEFIFAVPKTEQNPFAREIWAEIALPDERISSCPAFYMGKGRYAARVRIEGKGEYRLGKISETLSDHSVELSAMVHGTRRKYISAFQARSSIMLDPADSQRFILSSGERFVPVGINLAWPDKPALKFYKKTFSAFSREGLNWTRIWMSHWGGLNLDWVNDTDRRSPRDGNLDLKVAETWDRIVTMAEDNGVYLQLVLQHHGQYSSQVNSNWTDNPWSTANGGFLREPAEFFTSPEAIRLTKQKYRYIVARWAYSPAVMAWELFNEVHWVDAMRGETKNEAAVANWHSEMAAYIRSLDRYHHLITTSTEDVSSPVCAAMDYLQPHLYAPNILAGARKPPTRPDGDKRPSFFGEIGDDHLAITEEVKKTGVTIMPPVWASLTGMASQPAQAWQGAQLLSTNRIGELGAIAKFLAATKLLQRDGLSTFSPTIECAARVPLIILGGQLWQRRPPLEIELPLDGREELGFADIPRIFVGSKDSVDDGYANRATFHFTLPRPTTFTFHLNERNAAAGTIRISVDGTVAAEHSWPEHKPEISPGPPPLPETIAIPISSGAHTLLIENPGSPGWFDLSRIETGLDVSVLAAMGRRGSDFIFAWVYHREGVFSPTAMRSAQGELLLDAIPVGTWRVTWWNTLTGTPEPASMVKHTGGLLRIPTPLISRHAAVVLTREAD